jgi:hypothetical protein
MLRIVLVGVGLLALVTGASGCSSSCSMQDCPNVWVRFEPPLVREEGQPPYELEVLRDGVMVRCVLDEKMKCDTEETVAMSRDRVEGVALWGRVYGLKIAVLRSGAVLQEQSFQPTYDDECDECTEGCPCTAQVVFATSGIGGSD